MERIRIGYRCPNMNAQIRAQKLEANTATAEGAQERAQEGTREQVGDEGRTDGTQTNADNPGSFLVASASRAAKVFDSGDGVRDINLDIPEGSIFGFIGPSGSGKTTTVRMFTGVVLPTDGTVHVFGEVPSEFDADMRSRLGYMPQLSVLYPDLSVQQNLKFLGSLYGESLSRERMAEVLDFVELAGHEKKRVRDISGGMQRRLSLAAALIHKPDLIFLDEPTAGIDPVLRRKFWDHFTELKQQGRTLFVTTQYVGEAAYCDYVGVLADGQLLLVETPEGLRRAAYGGDLIDIEFANRPNKSVISELAGRFNAFQVTQTSPVSWRIVVDEAATTLPELGAWFKDNDVAITTAEEHVPPFDDVFVELVEAYRTNGTEGGSSEASAEEADDEVTGPDAARDPQSLPKGEDQSQ